MHVPNIFDALAILPTLILIFIVLTIVLAMFKVFDDAKKMKITEPIITGSVEPEYDYVLAKKIRMANMSTEERNKVLAREKAQNEFSKKLKKLDLVAMFNE